MDGSRLTDVAENGMTARQSGAKVEIYTWMTCGYCLRAKRLLADKDITFIEHAIDGDEEARRQMAQRAEGRTTVPQIFINGQGIGGFLELQHLEHEGHLEAMLSDQARIKAADDQGGL